MRALAVGLVVLALAACGGDGGDEEAAAPPTGAETVEVDEPDAKTIFVQNCSGCHTLKAAGTTGKVGPNLDESKPSVERARTMIENGGGGGLGVMPSFKGSLSPEQIDAVARFVSETAGG